MPKLVGLVLTLFAFIAYSNAITIPPALSEEQRNSVQIESAPASAADPTTAETALVEAQNVGALDITKLWSYGLTSIRTGKPLIEEGGEHRLDKPREPLRLHEDSHNYDTATRLSLLV